MIELYDTSALILAHRQPAVARELEPALRADEVAICAPIRLEYLNGARNAAEYGRFADVLEALRDLPVESRDWQRAMAVHRLLAERGPGEQRSVRLLDLLIAAVAERHAVGIVHDDADYDRIALVTSQPTRWLAPRPSVDDTVGSPSVTQE